MNELHISAALPPGKVSVSHWMGAKSKRYVTDNFGRNPTINLRSTTYTPVPTRNTISLFCYTTSKIPNMLRDVPTFTHCSLLSTSHLRVEREICYNLQSYCTQFPFDTCHLLRFTLAYRTAVLLSRISVGQKEISTGPSSRVLLLFLNSPNHISY
jgi:hypothetical protein